MKGIKFGQIISVPGYQGVDLRPTAVAQLGGITYRGYALAKIMVYPPANEYVHEWVLVAYKLPDEASLESGQCVVTREISAVFQLSPEPIQDRALRRRRAVRIAKRLAQALKVWIDWDCAGIALDKLRQHEERWEK